jgi:hypothetical protein
VAILVQRTPSASARLLIPTTSQRFVGRQPFFPIEEVNCRPSAVHVRPLGGIHLEVDLNHRRRFSSSSLRPRRSNPNESPCEDDGNGKKEEPGSPVMVKSRISDSDRNDRKHAGNDGVSQKLRCAVVNFHPIPLIRTLHYFNQPRLPIPRMLPRTNASPPPAPGAVHARTAPHGPAICEYAGLRILNQVLLSRSVIINATTRRHLPDIGCNHLKAMHWISQRCKHARKGMQPPKQRRLEIQRILYARQPPKRATLRPNSAAA